MKATVRVISSDSPRRPWGIRAASRSVASFWPLAIVSGVQITPGETSERLRGGPDEDLVERHAPRTADGEGDDLGGDGDLIVQLLRALLSLGVRDVVGQLGRHGAGL